MSIIGATWVWLFQEEFEKPAMNYDLKFMSITFGWFFLTIFVIFEGL
jgi:hypothetical protein